VDARKPPEKPEAGVLVPTHEPRGQQKKQSPPRLEVKIHALGREDGTQVGVARVLAAAHHPETLTHRLDDFFIAHRLDGLENIPGRIANQQVDLLFQELGLEAASLGGPGLFWTNGVGAHHVWGYPAYLKLPQQELEVRPRHQDRHWVDIEPE
jgi:hypothetical protein